MDYDTEFLKSLRKHQEQEEKRKIALASCNAYRIYIDDNRDKIIKQLIECANKAQYNPTTQNYFIYLAQEDTTFKIFGTVDYPRTFHNRDWDAGMCITVMCGTRDKKWVAENASEIVQNFLKNINKIITDFTLELQVKSDIVHIIDADLFLMLYENIEAFNKEKGTNYKLSYDILTKAYKIAKG